MGKPKYNVAIKIIKDRVTKANQAIFALKKTLGNPYLATPDLALTLFNKQIEPILLYGRCTWEQRPNKCIYHVYIKVDTIERQVRKQADSILYNILGRNLEFNICKAQSSENKLIIKLTQVAHKTELLYTCTGPPDKYASPTAELSELKMEPLRNKVILNAIRYWHRMELGNIPCLLYHAYQEC